MNGAKYRQFLLAGLVIGIVGLQSVSALSPVRRAGVAATVSAQAGGDLSLFIERSGAYINIWDNFTTDVNASLARTSGPASNVFVASFNASDTDLRDLRRQGAELKRRGNELQRLLRDITSDLRRAGQLGSPLDQSVSLALAERNLEAAAIVDGEGGATLFLARARFELLIAPARIDLMIAQVAARQNGHPIRIPPRDPDELTFRCRVLGAHTIVQAIAGTLSAGDAQTFASDCGN